MSHQDYISRTPKRKPREQSRAKEVEIDNSLPLKTKIVSVITLVAVVCFAGFLWSLRASSPEQAEAQTKPEQPQNATTKSVSLPEPPQEKWRYIEELKNKEVKVGEYEVAESGPYKLQCGAFKTMSQAETLKAKMAFAGFEASIRESRGKNGLYHIVILGPYEKKRTAEAHRHKLQNNNINHCRIWPWT